MGGIKSVWACDKGYVIVETNGLQAKQTFRLGIRQIHDYILYATFSLVVVVLFDPTHTHTHSVEITLDFNTAGNLHSCTMTAPATAQYSHHTHQQSFSSDKCPEPPRDPHRDAPSDCSSSPLGQLRRHVAALQTEINTFLTARMNLCDKDAQTAEDELDELDAEQ